MGGGGGNYGISQTCCEGGRVGIDKKRGGGYFEDSRNTGLICNSKLSNLMRRISVAYQLIGFENIPFESVRVSGNWQAASTALLIVLM